MPGILGYMNNERITLKGLEGVYPPSDSPAFRAEIRQQLESQNIRIAVLDDDPTGVQTVHDCELYTVWSEEDLSGAFASPNRMFYVLTNSRSVDSRSAEEMYRTIGAGLAGLSERCGCKLIAISRSDSTLRGHFAEEVSALKETLLPPSSTLPVPFIPVMFEAGRYTFESEHLVDSEGRLVKAQDTEFARDRDFGYGSSHLPTYVNDKLRFRHPGAKVKTIDLKTQRATDIAGVSELIRDSMDLDYLCPDALAYCDLEKFSLALLRVFGSMEERVWVCRSSSSFPRALSGMEPIPLLRGDRLIASKPPVNGGIVFVGSHVEKTSRQLADLLSHDFTEGVEISTAAIHRGDFSPETPLAAIRAATEEGRTPVVYTSRNGVFLPDTEENLRLSRTISNVVVDLFTALSFSPSFIVSKGGITSHDLLTRGLEVKKALVKGAILPGVPVLWAGAGGTTPFVIFPGNVGSDGSVTEAVTLLRSGGGEV